VRSSPKLPSLVLYQIRRVAANHKNGFELKFVFGCDPPGGRHSRWSPPHGSGSGLATLILSQGKSQCRSGLFGREFRPESPWEIAPHRSQFREELHW